MCLSSSHLPRLCRPPTPPTPKAPTRGRLYTLFIKTTVWEKNGAIISPALMGCICLVSLSAVPWCRVCVFHKHICMLGHFCGVRRTAGGRPARDVGRLGEFKESGGESERQTCSPELLFRFYLHVGLVSAIQISGVFYQHLSL